MGFHLKTVAEILASVVFENGAADWALSTYRLQNIKQVKQVCTQRERHKFDDEGRGREG